MPTSEIRSVAPIIEEVLRLQPRSVLDLGAGMGKYGVLLREYLDNAHGRFWSREWAVKINAVEAFTKYLTGVHLAVYDQVIAEDFSKFMFGHPFRSEDASPYKGNDLVLMIDSFEHLEREQGLKVLDTLLANNKHVIASVPMGSNFLPQGAVFGNEYETHRTNWDRATFTSRGGRLIHDEVCTVFSIPGKAR